MRTITHAQFREELHAQGVDSKQDYAFKCPVCGTVQSALDLIAAGAGKDFDSVRRYLGFSCVGRFTNAGPHTAGDIPGKGCDWTLGGLFKLHELEVTDEAGEVFPYFEIASPVEARVHALTHARRLGHAQ